MLTNVNNNNAILEFLRYGIERKVDAILQYKIAMHNE